MGGGVYVLTDLSPEVTPTSPWVRTVTWQLPKPKGAWKQVSCVPGKRNHVPSPSLPSRSYHPFPTLSLAHTLIHLRCPASSTLKPPPGTGDQAPAGRDTTHMPNFLSLCFCWCYSFNRPLLCVENILTVLRKLWWEGRIFSSGPIPTTSAFEALLGPAQLLTCLSLPLAGGEGSFEITQWKSHNPCLAPRQRLNTCELSVMAATLFQQDHTEWLFIPELTLTFLPHLSPKAVLKALFLTYSKERTLSVSVNTA